MIKSFKHKGLKLFFETGKTKGIQPAHAKKLRLRLAVLDEAQKIEEIDTPGFKLHTLKGDREEIWSISVNGNWRITFKFKDGDVYIVNYEDYH
jgi:proteic killer suppression protein